MKKLLLSCMLALGIGASSQILVNEGFEGSSLPTGWASTTTGTGTTSTPSGYGTSAGTACVGSKTVYKNIYETTYTGWNLTYTSTASNAAALTYSFKYLAKGYGSSGIVSGSVAADYSVDGGTNWIDLQTPVVLDSPNATPIPCTTVSGVIPAGTIPAGANFKFRLKSTSNPTADFYMGFDDVQLSQPLTNPPACTTLSAPATAATGIVTAPMLTWGVAAGAQTYKLKVGTTSGGSDVLNSVDVGNITSYQLTGLAGNTTYYVTVIPTNSIGDAVGCTQSTFTTWVLVANDECTNAVALTVNPDQNCGTVTAGSTLNSSQSMAAAPCNGNPDDDVWYSFVAANTAHTISLSSIVSAGTTSTTDAYFQVLSGACGSLTSVLCSDPNSATVGGLVPGQTYYVRVYTYGESMTGSRFINFNICVGTPPPPPANDDCSGAISLTVNPDLSCGTTTAGNTLNATQSMSAGVCNGTPDDDIWYSFVAGATSQVVSLSNVVSTGSTSGTDMYFQVLSGACGSLTSVVCSDDNSKIVTGLTVGQTYYVRVYTYSGSGYNASFNICIGTLPPPPANDDCANAVALVTGGNFAQNAVTGTTVSTTNTPALSAACLTTPTNVAGNVWYKITVPASGSITIEADAVTGSALTDTVMSVFGDCTGSNTILCDDDTGNGNFSKISLTGQTPGAILYVSVWRYSNAGGGSDGEFQISAYDASLLGTSEVSGSKNTLKVYPNPFVEVLHISDASKVKTVSVSDAAGRLVKTIINPDSSLQLGELKSGMYLVTIEMKDGSKQTIKAIKK